MNKWFGMHATFLIVLCPPVIPSGREGNVGLLIEIKEFAEVEAAVKGLGRRALLNFEICYQNWYLLQVYLLVRDRTRAFDGFSEDGISPNKEYSILLMDHLAENLKKSKQKIEILFDEDHSQLPPGSIYSVLKKKI
ncbi:unnamed protein product [Bursaphelenchus xylophilus]|uniref:(pine wood nematode) hypothetical protein n=1 Tax=Bursaphelenchus xylophilus TaxID=6326 RepID=A0A7I8XQV5_BURXY|nr:unnamed protein product [Bursaphelenchus xylophilus]CAG9088532.1 unnamed protein product [Bursaphelenchus xylophilus]